MQIAAFTFSATVLFFAIAMILYLLILFRRKRPVSYYDLRNLRSSGDSLAKVALLFWNASIFGSLLFALLMLWSL